MALPPRQDGRAHDRHQDRYRRIERCRVPARHPLPAAVPRPLGDSSVVVTGASDARGSARQPQRPRRALPPFPGRRAASALRPFASGLAGRGARGHSPGVRRRRAARSTRSGRSPRRRAERVREGYRALLDDPGGEIALAASTHELIVRWLSALPLAAQAAPRHHRRRVPHPAPAAGAARGGGSRGRSRGRRTRSSPWPSAWRRRSTSAPRRSSPRRSSSRPRGSCRIWTSSPRHASGARRRSFVDAYHALGAIPFSLRALGLESALVTGGGYKYLQLGEGNAFLRLPRGLDLRPVVTGWFAEFWTKTADKSLGPGRLCAGRRRARRRDLRPTSHYRAARVFDFFVEHGLDAEFPARGLAASGRIAGTRFRCARSSCGASPP